MYHNFKCKILSCKKSSESGWSLRPQEGEAWSWGRGTVHKGNENKASKRQNWGESGCLRDPGLLPELIQASVCT